jgi:hypothetical protein
MQELPKSRWNGRSEPTEPQKNLQVRWAVITNMYGRVVVEAETADAAREQAERKGYIVLQVNRDDSDQAVSF